MRTLLAALLAAAVLGTASASASLPSTGVLVPGKSLGGIELGYTKADVRKRWGPRHARCRSCLSETWYFTYRRFMPQGAAIVFRRGRVRAVYTIWQPKGWLATDGLTLGATESDVTRLEGTLPRTQCSNYATLVRHGRPADTSYYLYNGTLWGFGIMRPGSSPCP